jgi:hypothetical protein
VAREIGAVTVASCWSAAPNIRIGNNILAESTIKGGQWATERLVTLMELLRIYAEKYVRSSSQLAVFSDIFGNSPDESLSAEELSELARSLRGMLSLCTKGDLPVTKVPLETILFSLSTATGPETKKRVVKHFLDTALERMPDEMSTKIYFQLPYARKELYEEPRKKWDEVIARFPNAIQDIEESSKCYALSRYAACVFHCVQIIEHGLLPLGSFLSVK